MVVYGAKKGDKTLAMTAKKTSVGIPNRRPPPPKKKRSAVGGSGSLTLRGGGASISLANVWGSWFYCLASFRILPTTVEKPL